MKSILVAAVVGFAVVLLQSCSPDTSSPNARQGFNSAIKPNVMDAPSNSPETTPSPVIAAEITSPLVEKPSIVEERLEAEPQQEKVVSLQKIRATAWPAVPTTTELEASASRYLVSLEMYRRGLEKKRESLELARREGVMQSSEYAAMIDRYRQGIRAYRLGYARYKQRQAKP